MTRELRLWKRIWCKKEMWISMMWLCVGWQIKPSPSSCASLRHCSLSIQLFQSPHFDYIYFYTKVKKIFIKRITKVYLLKYYPFSRFSYVQFLFNLQFIWKIFSLSSRLLAFYIYIYIYNYNLDKLSFIHHQKI